MARKPIPLITLLTLLAFGLFLPIATAASARKLPTEAAFRAVSVCRPPAPGHASCLAQVLLPKARGAVGKARISAVRPRGSAAEAGGLSPAELHTAYNLPTTAPVPITVAVVDAYSDPAIERDLGVFDREYNLPPCTKENGCLTVIGSGGAGAPLPPPNGEWAFETSLDVETVHGICENCRILLVEAENSSEEALAAAVETAYREGARVISTSFGGREPASELAAYAIPGVVITAAAGDNGYLNWAAPNQSERGSVDYPAASPHVVAVGATRLVLGPHGERVEESVWNDSQGATGSGCSEHFPAPVWQLAVEDWSEVGCGNHRAVADLAADGDPYSGLAIYDSLPWNGSTLGWVTAGGTSMASPLVAAAFALAGGPSGARIYAPAVLYENALDDPSDFHPVTIGANGPCAPTETGCPLQEAAAGCSDGPICTATHGYSGPAGLGSPNGVAGLRFPGAPVAAGKGLPKPVARKTKAAKLTVLHAGRNLIVVRFAVAKAGPVVLKLLAISPAARDARRGSMERLKLLLRRRLAARPGQNALTLRVRRLRPGRYRLSLLVGGRVASAVFRVG